MPSSGTAAGVEVATSRVTNQRPNHYTTKPHQLHSNNAIPARGFADVVDVMHFAVRVTEGCAMEPMISVTLTSPSQ